MKDEILLDLARLEIAIEDVNIAIMNLKEKMYKEDIDEKWKKKELEK